MDGARRIPVAGPSITQAELDAVAQATRSGWYEGAGQFQARFEQAFAAHTGRRFAVSLPSCTSALHLALAGLGIGPGDEVIVPELTWIATAAPIDYVGAQAVFADVDARSLCLTARSVAACLTPRTRAIIAVDLYGNMPDLEALAALARSHGIALLEDAAQAIGSTFDGRPAGSFGVASAFSFHGSKTLTTGEGGMLVTDDAQLHERVLSLRDHGRAPGDVSFRNSEIGFKYRMSAMQAALGLAQLERLPELVAKKRHIFDRYDAALRDVAGLRLNESTPRVFDSVWMTTARWDPRFAIDKRELGARLADHGIDTRPLFHPLSALPAYAACPQAAVARARNDVSRTVSPWGLNLPSALELTDDDIDHAASSLRAILRAIDTKRGANTPADQRRGDGDGSAAPWSASDYDPQAEGQAFDRRIQERLDAGFVPDLRRAVRCEYFYKSFWRDPHFVSLYMGPIARAYEDALSRWAPPGAAILDVGCGAGYFSLELARAGHHVKAIDVSLQSIAAARCTLADNPFREGFGSLEYRCTDFAQVGGSFDVVIFSGSLHHFPAVEKVIERAHSLIRPGGLLICYEPIHEAFREQDAAQATLIRSLLSLAGLWYEAPETLGVDGTDLDAALEDAIAAVHHEYVLERDPGEPQGQSPHDLESTGTEILEALRARFEELVYRPMVSFNHRMFGGLRGPDATVKRIANLLSAYERLGLVRGHLGPSCFLFVGRR